MRDKLDEWAPCICQFWWGADTEGMYRKACEDHGTGNSHPAKDDEEREMIIVECLDLRTSTNQPP